MVPLPHGSGGAVEWALESIVQWLCISQACAYAAIAQRLLRNVLELYAFGILMLTGFALSRILAALSDYEGLLFNG